jgi:hypothetical protein
MMPHPPKPQTASGYSTDHTLDCERVLVTLLNAFGTLKDTLRLVGGLVPRYLTPEALPDVPAHFGTSDVDVVLNLQVIAEGEGYDSLSDQLTARGFERFVEANQWESAWRWKWQISEHAYVLVEFLQGALGKKPGSQIPIDGEKVAALAIPHAEITHNWYCERQITADLLDGRGVAVEVIRFADVVAFIILKALAFDNRNQPKDAADLIHVMRYAGTVNEVAALFLNRIKSGEHPEAIKAGLDALQRKFAEGNGEVEGYRLTGPVLYGQFLHGLGDDASDERIRDQRFATGLVTEVLSLIQQGNS